MYFLLNNEVKRKRLPQYKDLVHGIQTYDIDNLYPQRVSEIKKLSYTVSTAIARLAEFYAGAGFEDEVLGSLVVNDDGTTMDELIEVTSEDLSEFRGEAYLIKYNMNYRIHAIIPIEFSFCRFGISDDYGDVYDIKLSNNWEKDRAKCDFKIYTYPVFNPDPQVVRAQVAEYGFEDYPGQLLVVTPKKNLYPLCSFDPVLDTAQAQGEIQVFELSKIQNQFGVTAIFKYPGEFESDEAEEKFKKKLNPLKGARGVNSLALVQNPTGEDLGELVEKLDLPRMDNLLDITNKNVKNTLRENFALPAEILGVLPEGGMFNRESILEAYTYVNTMTESIRLKRARLFKRLFQYWRDPISVSNFNIKPKMYGISTAVNQQKPSTTVPPNGQA